MIARLLESREIAPQVRHFVFDVPEVERLSFVPGQFVSLRADLENQEITRAYSIASPPDGNCFELCLNLVEDGLFSPHLFELSPGDSVEMAGPLGTFTLRQPVGDCVFVATGTGIAPFRSMLYEQLRHDLSNRFTLLFGVRHEYGVLYRSEFEALAKRHPNFRFWPALSRPTAAWTGRVGHVQTHLVEAVGDRRDLTVYVCGLKAMVDDVRSMLKQLGFERRRIVYEKYD